MQLRRTLWIVICLSTIAVAQTVAYRINDHDVTISQGELERRVFDGENEMIAQFAKQRPIVETYVQSLDPDARPEPVMDDAYFLRRVEINPDSPHKRIEESYGLGGTARSRRIAVNNGEHWPLHPAGFVEMLFPDISDFSRKSYRLTFEAQDTLGNTECLRIAVEPTASALSGQFAGELWVDAAGFRIVRIRGTFVRKRSNFVGKYLDILNFNADTPVDLQFDSWRQEVAPGIWMPAHTYFDDGLTWDKGQLRASYHYRGHTWTWGYGEHAEAPLTSAKETMADPLSKLQSAGLIAHPSVSERELESMLSDLSAKSHIRPGDVRVHILMTTPIELFSVGNDIVVSRGLLNIVPNRSILVGLLAREMVHVMQRTRSTLPNAAEVFDDRRSSDFHGFAAGPKGTAAEENHRACLEVFAGTPYADSIDEAESFLEELEILSRQLPNLLHGGFGYSPVAWSGKRGSNSRSPSLPLRLGAQYGIDSVRSKITAPNARDEEASAREIVQSQKRRLPFMSTTLP